MYRLRWLIGCVAVLSLLLMVLEPRQRPAVQAADDLPSPAATIASATNLYLPLIRITAPDRYANWQAIAAPVPGTAVNFLYVAESPACAGPGEGQWLPTPLLAATGAGIYRLIPAQAPDTAPTWEGRTAPNIEASHIISASGSLFAGAFNQGFVLRSDDNGMTWNEEALPNNTGTYRLASVEGRIFAAGKNGLYVRENGVWSVEAQIPGATFSVAAMGTLVYAVQIGAAKDTLWYSAVAGDRGTWQILATPPDPVRFLQVLEPIQTTNGAPEAIVSTVGNGLYRLNAAGLTPFSQGVQRTAYGLWRDERGRIYAAFREDGGLQRFLPEGGVGENLSAAPGAPPQTERLFSVNGRATGFCPILAVGSSSGNVWLRRIP